MATPETLIVLGDYAIQSEGDLQLLATGAGKSLSLNATESDGSIQVQADKNVVISAGQALVSVDSAKKQATLQGFESVKVAAGPPAEMGAVIDMTPTGLNITLAKIISIKMSPAGIELKAAETTLRVGVEGITLKGPLIQENADAAKKVSAPLEQQQASATRQFNAGINMIG